MGGNPIIANIGGIGGGLLRLHSDPCPRHCDPYGAGHSGADSYSISDSHSTHGYPSPNVSPGNNGARSFSYAGLPEPPGGGRV